MITLKKVPLADIEKYVTIAFEGDNELVEKYHFADKTLEETISTNVKFINDLNIEYPLNCYSINLGEVSIGFTVTGENLLYSFGINKQVRNKIVVLAWWKLVVEKLKDFACPLNIENTRAVNFFVRNGMEVYETTKENILLIYKS